jgi:hypothetical protein
MQHRRTEDLKRAEDGVHTLVLSKMGAPPQQKDWNLGVTLAMPGAFRLQKEVFFQEIANYLLIH